MGAQDSEDGFGEVFDRYAPAILRYAQRRLESREAAQDVVSDTFIAAWRHWDRRPAPEVLLPWLYAIAGNAVRDQWRSAQRQRRLTGRLSALRPASHSADPGEGVVLGRSISQALAALPAADREVLRLVAWEGQTDARMLGTALGLRPASARSRVLRARRRLRALLDEADNPGSGPAAQVTAASPPSTPGRHEMSRRTSFRSAVTDIQSLLGDADPATADLDDATRAWLRDTRQAIIADPRGPGRRARAQVPRRARGPGWRVLAAAGALAVAAGLAGGLLAAPLAGSRPARGGHANPSLTAAQFLNNAAAAAARQPALHVRDDQYMYIASEERWATTFATAGGGDGRTVVEPLHKREIWLPVSDICKPGLLRYSSPGPARKINVTGISCPNQGGWGYPTYRFLQSLPTDPRTLLNTIYAATKGQGQGSNREAFATIGDMLREAIAPPDISAALYRTAALIPGVRIIPHATDILGQSGVGVQFTRSKSPAPGVPPYRPTWIFNPTTLQWIGETDGTVHGKVMGSVVLKRAIVDRLGQRP